MILNIATVLEQERQQVEQELERHLPAEGEYPERIHEAIRYSVLNGGKRLRPIITLAAARALGHDGAKVVKAACSVSTCTAAPSCSTTSRPWTTP